MDAGSQLSDFLLQRCQCLGGILLLFDGDVSISTCSHPLLLHLRYLSLPYLQLVAEVGLRLSVRFLLAAKSLMQCLGLLPCLLYIHLQLAQM